ncbi:MAG TPA: cadherin domain-containing protein [Prolixibacteraceae bacterium]|jgi:hypothetical protein
MKLTILLTLVVAFVLTFFSCRKDNNPPTMMDQSFIVKENSTPGLVCATIGASDPDQDQLTYRMVEENLNFPFEVDPNNGNVKIRLNASLDYELAQQYKFQVKVSDGSQTASAIMTINISDEQEIPNVIDQSFDINENIEGIYSIGNVKFKSKGLNDEFNFKIVEGNSSNLFFIGEKSGELFLSKAERLNYEGEKSYSLTVKVQNLTTPDLYAIITIGVNVIDINEKPAINDQSFSMMENSQNNTEIGSLIASDVDVGQSLNYSILQSSIANAVNVDSNSGKLTVGDKSKFDFETNNKIILAIKVTDNGSGALSDTANVTVNITDVNENPIITTKNLQVDENSASGNEVGAVIANSYAGTPIEYSIVAGNVTGIFAINKSTGMISVAQSGVLNYETKNSYSLTIKVNDTANPKYTANAVIAIELNDVNEHPVIADGLFTAKTSVAVGSMLGRVMASDPDGQPLLYSIASGNTEGYFSIDPVNGTLLLAKQVVLNGLDKIDFALTIRVKDNGLIPLSAEANVTVTILENTIPQNGLIAYYPFNGNAIDESINDHDGDLLGVVSTSDRNDKANSAYSFNGIDNYIKLDTQIGNGVRTISLWFRLDMNIDASLDHAVTLVTRDGDPTNKLLFALGFIPSGWAGTAGKLRFLYSKTTSDYYYIQSNSTSWQKDRWYHVVVMIHPTEGMKMYIDNVKQTSTNPFNEATANTVLNTFIGSYSATPNRFFSGKIDDILFYNRAVTEAEINDLYHQ